MFFKKFREKRADEKANKRIQEEVRKTRLEEERQEELKKQKAAQKKAEAAAKKEDAPVEKKPAPAKKTVKTPAEGTTKKVEKAVPAKTSTGVSGKYEVYPEAGFYKFRLKANNGEILLVSNGYKTADGAKKGIDTVKKNLEKGQVKFNTDKNGYTQFRISTPNDGRLVITGEIYPSEDSAKSAYNSTRNFGMTDNIVDLDSIPESEVREWIISVEKTPKANGKFECFIDAADQKWKGRLIASNGQVLFVTPSYVSKSGVLKGYEAVKNQIDSDSFHILRDKQNRYQFMVCNASGQILVTGETYKTKDAAVSAARSTRSFLGDAKIVDVVAEEKAKEKEAKAAADKDAGKAKKKK